jgi:hypothetical protein
MIVVTLLLATHLLCPDREIPAAGQVESASDPSRYDVIWKTASAGAHESMPLGNGDVGVNVWTDGEGSLRFYISKTDAWSENGRLLKIGGMKVTANPPLAAVQEQRLDLGNGEYIVRCGDGDGSDSTEVRLWVDADHNAIHVTMVSQQPRTVTAAADLWRTEPTPYPLAEVSDLLEDRSKPNRLHEEVIVQADQVVQGLDESVMWYHQNLDSDVPARIAKMQGLDEYLDQQPDPLAGRIFGATVLGWSGKGRPAKSTSATALETAIGTHHHFAIGISAGRHGNSQSLMESAIGNIWSSREGGLEQSRARHQQWWHQFWQRSWIHLEENRTTETAGWSIPQNDYSLKIGEDQHGANQFKGAIDDVKCSLASGLRISATVTAEKQLAGGGRIVDKVTPGGSDGFLFDTYPGNSLRLIVGKRILQVANVLPVGVATEVGASMDPKTGVLSISVNGEVIATSNHDASSNTDVIARAYALQRWMDACAGRGKYPIKFNGSIFTVPHEGKFGGADYRRWGPGYWWQNTRLPYLSMCASGDFEMMRPLFRMYAEQLMPLHKHRTQQQLGHGGAFIPECIYFWGPVFTASYGWTPFVEREDKLQDSRWHKWEWVAGLELVWMMLDYVEHTEDWEYFQKWVVPTAHEVLLFFQQHSPLDEKGRLVMTPSQALETWWDCTNPMPEVAGLHAVTSRLMTYDAKWSTAEERKFWKQVKDITPPLPVWRKDGLELLAPAERFEQKSNVENPELYAVFPFRQISFEKPQVELGIRALENRWDRGASGWRQDDLFMAYLGLTEQARDNLISRARNKHDGSKFPAFWGPNYDWVPDQDHGGVLMRTLQAMLMQTDGRKIYLLPAWPREWDAEFKLHAPFRTTLTGRVVDGKVVDLVVQPPSRRADVVMPN